MNLISAAMAAVATQKKPPKPKWWRALHVRVESRSEEWNAWRERQALHARPTLGPIRKAPPKPARTAAELRARRLSTRATRRRRERAS